ncbi:HCO3 transporter family-domain-containing protein [Amylostereum chailletii]|nr:HCO3 transporter family-domain-containing protein [Amylostereum chailletii]
MTTLMPRSNDSGPTSPRSSTAFHIFTWIRPLRKLRPGLGIVRDIRARAPWYRSDWIDAWNYRVVPATALIFFANVLPGIAFSLDLIETTEQYGVAEVLLSSFMAAFVFSIFGAQPLCIAGVTGPITVLNKTIFDILEGQPDSPDYLQFIGWVYMWGAILHWVTAILNACNFLKYVTLFSCDTFGFYVSWVYLQYGIQVLTRQFGNPETSLPGTLVSIILALLMLGAAACFRTLSNSTLFHRHVRRFFADYGMPISLIAASGMAYWGRFNATNPLTLPVNKAFQPANERSWLIHFWELDGKWVGIAFPFGLVLWILFFFDHNVSVGHSFHRSAFVGLMISQSLMAQGSEFPLRKPPGFHYDFFLLGVTTFLAGLLGVPAPNGLIPQAPIHTTSLVILGRPLRDRKDAEDGTPVDSGSVTPGRTTEGDERDSDKKGGPEKNEKGGRQDILQEAQQTWSEVPIAVVEQRVSNLAQGAPSLVLLTGPFLHVLHLIPRGVLAGLFWYMGLDALAANGITKRLLYFLNDRAFTPKDDPLRRVRKSRILMFVAVQLVGFGATFAITQTIGEWIPSSKLWPGSMAMELGSERLRRASNIAIAASAF